MTIVVMEVTLDAYNDPECEGDLIKIYRKYRAHGGTRPDELKSAHIMSLDADDWTLGEFQGEMFGTSHTGNELSPRLNIILGYHEELEVLEGGCFDWSTHYEKQYGGTPCEE